MKKMLGFSFLFLFIASISNAQYDSKTEEEVVREIWGMAIQDLTASVLQLDQTTAAKFWPIWDEYRKAKRKIADTKVKYIIMYADAYEDMTNEKASEITKGLLKNEKALVKIKEKYFNKIKNKVSAIKAAQFIQIEATIDNEIRALITENLPLVPDSKK